MRKLPAEDRARILHLLCEGNSIRSVTRLTGASKNTVAKLLVAAGRACAEFHDVHVRGVTSKQIQCDEIWSFTYVKNRNIHSAKTAPMGAGDIWTWTAIDSDTKLIVSWYLGDRHHGAAVEFLTDLRDRLANKVQLSTDGHKAYLSAVREVDFDADYAMLIKLYGTGPASPGRYSPPIVLGTKTRVVQGNPDMTKVNTSYAERQNLTMRMSMRRFTRLTNGFSKKVENHAAAVALHFVFYNFVRVHQTLRATPAMAAGLADHPWKIADIVSLVEAAESKPGKRGPYKPRIAA